MDRPSKKLTPAEVEGRKIVARSLPYLDLVNYCSAEDPRVCNNDLWKEKLRRDFPKLHKKAVEEYQDLLKSIERHNRIVSGLEEDSTEDDEDERGSPRQKRILPPPPLPNYREIYEEAYFKKIFPKPQSYQDEEADSDDEDYREPEKYE
jgi:hypothetical protein